MSRGGNAGIDTSPLLSAPYASLAVHYDTVMAHVDYPGWSQHLRRLYTLARSSQDVFNAKHPAVTKATPKTPSRSAQKSVAPPRRVLELAAGTCRLAEYPVFPEVFSVHTDLSPQMLACARSDDEVFPPRAACDARWLPFKNGASALGGDESNASEGFDLALMVYDSLNYLTQPEEVERAFKEVFRVLTPGGVFLVDVTTETCSRRWFADALDFQETEAGSVVRASRYDTGTRTQLNLFTFFTIGDDGRYTRTEEVHRQRVWPAAFLKKTARAAGFEVRACLADFTLNPGTDRDERLHFVLQKPVLHTTTLKKPKPKTHA
jgi:SAM-dependent methyltransferase